MRDSATCHRYAASRRYDPWKTYFGLKRGAKHVKNAHFLCNPLPINAACGPTPNSPTPNSTLVVRPRIPQTRRDAARGPAAAGQPARARGAAVTARSRVARRGGWGDEHGRREGWTLLVPRRFGAAADAPSRAVGALHMA